MKRWTVLVLSSCILSCLLIAGLNVYADPHFLYSKPKDGFSYAMRPVEYTNPGILKNFSYDAILIGSSMTAQASASTLDKGLNLNTIKIIAFGARYCEFYDLLSLGFSSGNTINHVFWGLDFHDLHIDKPINPKSEYLFDSNVLNDVKYLLNKEVALRSAYNIYRTFCHIPTVTFDTYAFSEDNEVYSKDALINSINYDRTVKPTQIAEDSELPAVRDNIEKNILSLVRAHPDTTFHFFISPFSIMYYDRLTYAYGRLDAYMKNAEYAIELLLPYDNVRLYYFSSVPEIICNLDRYKDVSHHDPGYNAMILQAAIDDTHRLSKENYKEMLQKTRQIVDEYDFDSVFEF